MRTPAVLRRAYLSELLFGLSMGIWSIVFNFQLSQLGYSDAAIGGLLSFGYLVTAATAFFVGRIGDVIGFPFVAAAGALLCGVSMLLLAIARAGAMIYLSRLLYSAGYGCIMSMEFTLPVSLAPPEQKQPLYNRILLLYQAGNILGSLLCGWGADGLKRLLGNPYAPLSAVAGVLYLVICLLRCRMPRQSACGQRIDPRVYLRSLRDRQVQSFLLFGLLTLGLFALTTSCLNLILRYRYAVSDGVIGTALSVYALAGCSALAILPLLIRRFRLYRISTVVLAVQTLVILAMAGASLSAFTALFVVRTVTCNILYTSVDGPMLRSIPEAGQGTYSGMRIFAKNAGKCLALRAAGWIIDARRFVLLFVLSGAVAAAQNAVYHGLCKKYLKNE